MESGSVLCAVRNQFLYTAEFKVRY